MFKKSRRRIVAAIMFVLVLLWVGTLVVIYASSYYEMQKQNEQMLQSHSDMYVLPKSADASVTAKPKHGGNTGDKHGVDPKSPRYQLSTFYHVAVSYDGQILDIKNASSMVHTNEDLKELAEGILQQDRITGTENNLVFYKADKGGYTLVTFIDNTVVNESARMLLRYTLIFGGVALILLFFLSVFLAKKIVKPLEESYQKQKQFISDAGHELKTPVSVVGANAELLCREIGDNQWLANIQYENTRMGILVGKLLELARTENITPQMECVDFSRLVSGEGLPFESVAFEKGLVLKSEIASGIVVEGNAPQLKQLVAILLDNAISHSNDEGEVYVSLIKEHGYARLTVMNRGEEIPVHQREQIFERFYRVDTARNGEDKHYGLGLAIAKAIATSHNGHIEVLCHDGLVEFSFRIPSR